jgi:hypothetical protein
MKKGILSGLGLLFVVAILMGGCSKPEEKKVEAPPEMKQTIEQKAPAVQEQAAEMKAEEVEKVEPAAESAEEKAATMQEQAVEAGKEMGQQALESAAEEKMPEEVKQAVDAAKSYSGGIPEKAEMAAGAEAASEVKAPAVETGAAPEAPSTSIEEAVKEGAAEQGIKLPTK